jgi:hypothetical protein
MRRGQGTWGVARQSLGSALVATVAIIVYLWLISASAGAATCPNDAVRTGLSSGLPDCRAYELVSPPDTNGRLLEGISGFDFEPAHDLFPTELASPSRDSIVYLAYNGPLLNSEEPNGVVDVYQTLRSSGAWQVTRRMTPSGPQAVFPTPGGVSSDHQYTFTHVGVVEGGTRPAGTLAGKRGTDYLGNPDGSFEPSGLGSLGTEALAQGRYISGGGDHVIFSTGRSVTQSIWCQQAGLKCPVIRLEPAAPSTGTAAVYDRSADGPTHVVSLLPGDVTPAAGEDAVYQGTSRDGSTVAFKIKGTLFVRVDNAKTEAVAAGDPTYAGLSTDGAELFYVSGGNIHQFETADEENHQVNPSGDAEVVNVSADGSHVYFISPSQLDGSKGTAGQPNMYVWSGGASEYVTTVVSSDLEVTSGSLTEIPALTRWTTWAVAPLSGIERGPGADSSRTTHDGTVLLFESRAQLTSYENEGHTEIYRYDDEDKSLLCISCNPSVEPATADARLQEVALVRTSMVIHNVSDDGSRAFFETPEALVDRDTDDINDIYEWRQEGVGSSLALISPGQSVEYPSLKENQPNLPLPNVLLSVTPTGDDVVFISEDALVPGVGTGGTEAIYDARVGGGFPESPTAHVCSEQACRQVANQAPTFPAPQSKQTVGSGNVKPGKHRCRRGHRRSKSNKHRRCRKRHSKKEQLSATAATRPSGLEGQPAQATASEARDLGGASESAKKSSAAPLTTLSGGDFEEFGIKSVGAEESTAAAGRHPDFTTRFALNYHINGEGSPQSDARTREVSVSLPPGLLGDPNVIPRCGTGQLVAFANCPIDSQVGITKVVVSGIGNGKPATEPIYNLTPPHPSSEVARLGFYALSYPVFIDVSVRTASDYGVTATVHSAPGLAPLLEATTVLWANPPDPSHDELRLTAKEALNCSTACEAPGGKRPSGLEPIAFMTNPSACQEQEVGFSITSYQLPGQVFSASAPMDPITDCQGLPFAPTFEAHPTSHVAGAPTGLDTVLKLPQSPDPDVPGTATMREARVTLPEGMTIASGAADGLEACSEAQVAFHEEVDAACPDASKLGSATILSPALSQPLEGALYQRSPEPGHLFRLWLVTDELGLHVKLPGEIHADPDTGRLTAIFANLPQVPVEEIDLDVWGGPRAPLKNPDSCGTYETAFAFQPHSQDPAVSGQAQMTIDEGCGPLGFSPQLHGGATNPVAGAFSPFVLDLAREDGEQDLAGFEVSLPKGELAKLKGVALCPDAQVQSGACPADSKIGSIITAAGPGPNPLWIPQPGKAPTAIYLAGPYKSAPYSIVSVVPAQAGPFDLGNVVVRSALALDPESAVATVKTDPLPQILEGVPIIYRRLHALIDRPGFTLNPTNCRELAITSDISSTQGAIAHPSDRFQVDGCKALAFKPKLTLKLKGGTQRGDYPALTATMKARAGDANIARTSVALPHSEFLAQEHIVTICTRVRFAAHNCPKGSVYGKAKVFTPLLDKPLEGPVYLRSSSHPLPDLVVALRGQIEVDLVGRIDSINGGIRTSFNQVPDAPVTMFVLQMKGGAKGLLTNSTDICKGEHRATVMMGAQNGRRRSSQVVLGVGCGR